MTELWHDDRDIAAAIAVAKKTLRPAVRAGMFSDKPPRRLVKFFLKFAMTSLSGYQKASWDETAFSYDDGKARRVIMRATAGNADAVLREIARAKLREGLPPNLADYVDNVLDAQHHGRPGPRRNFDRDVSVYFAVEKIRQRGFNATRNESSAEYRESACSIVVTALAELGATVSEKTAERIYREIQRTIPAMAPYSTISGNS